MSIQAGATLFAPRLLRDIRLTLATPNVWKLCKNMLARPDHVPMHCRKFSPTFVRGIMCTSGNPVTIRFTACAYHSALAVFGPAGIDKKIRLHLETICSLRFYYVVYIFRLTISRVCAVAQYAVLEANGKVNGIGEISHPSSSQTLGPIWMPLIRPLGSRCAKFD